MHRYFKFDGSSQGVPVCYIHANTSHRSHNDALSTCRERFDWVNVLLEQNRGIYKGQVIQIPVQMCCLLEIKHNGISTPWFLGIQCAVVDRSSKTFCPFPTVKYNLTSKKSGCNYRFLLSKVDIINEPASIIPITLNTEEYRIQNDIEARQQALFTCIPFGFLFRDDWGDSQNSGYEDVHSKFCDFDYIKKIIRSPLSIYNDLGQALQKFTTAKNKRRKNDNESIDNYMNFLKR